MPGEIGEYLLASRVSCVLDTGAVLAEGHGEPPVIWQGG